MISNIAKIKLNVNRKIVLNCCILFLSNLFCKLFVPALQSGYCDHLYRFTYFFKFYWLKFFLIGCGHGSKEQS